MQKIHFIEWRPTDFLASKISRRPLFEQGVERIITAMICENGGPIAIGDMELADIADRGRCDAGEVKAAIAEMMKRGIINCDNGVYMIPWLVPEIARINAISSTNSRNARKRWHAVACDRIPTACDRIPTACDRIPTAMPSQCETMRPGNQDHYQDHYQDHNNKPSPSSSPIPPSGGGEGGGGGFTVPMVDPATVPEAKFTYTPQKPLEAPQTPQGDATAQKPYVDPETGSTAGKRPFNEFCVMILANGKIQPGGESAAFRQFMLKFPKSDGREEAADAWNRAMFGGTDPKHIMQALEADLPKLREREAKFLPRAANWLADAKWMVYEEAAKAEAQRRAADIAARPMPTPEEVAAAEEKKNWDDMRIRSIRETYRANGMVKPTPAQLAQIDAEIEQMKRERKK